jgi:perosamine synthetase
MYTTFDKILSFIRSYYKKPEGPIQLHEPLFVGNERKYVIDAIDSTFVSSVGKYVNDFESQLARYTGASYAVAVSNGTSALHLALLLAGVKRGELVISQSLSFIATCNAISYIGAEPLFIDVDRDTLGLSPKHLETFLRENCVVREGQCFHKATNRRIAACVPMHTFGHPVHLPELVRVCNEFMIPLVEDAAESIGSRHNGKHTGTFGLLGIFSFNGNKTITCGGGGAIITSDEQIAKKAKHLSTQAKVPHRWEFVHDMVGYNYRMPNLNAAMACAQLEVLDTFIASKRKLAAEYAAFFKEVGVHYAVEPTGTLSNYWLNAVLFNDRKERDEFLQYSNDRGIMTRPVWTLMTELEMFKNCISGDLANSRFIADRLVNLPSSPLA